MNVTVEITTVKSKFPDGTAQAPFLFELLDQSSVLDPATGDPSVAPIQQKSAGLQCVFANPPPATYIAQASALGVLLKSAPFTVSADDLGVQLDVPATIVVTLPPAPVAAPAPAPAAASAVDPSA